MTNQLQSNLSSLTWPFNPAGHFSNHSGQNNISHVSNTVLVYVPGKVPTPWPYLLATLSMSLVITIFGLVSSSKKLIMDKPDRRSKMSYAREPGIVYSIYRTISIIIACARAPHTRTIPSSLSTASVAFSLITNLLNWKDEFDMFSYAVLVCTTALWCLIPYEYSLNVPLIQEKDSPEAYSYGSMRLVGGNCPRKLQNHENCATLKTVGCEVGSHDNLISHQVVLMGAQYAAQLIGAIGVGVCLPFMWHGYLRRKGQSDKRILSTVLKHATAVILLVMFAAGGFFALESPTTYVDAMEEATSHLNGTAAAPNSTVWTDCFTVFEPKDRWGFTALWFQQEWNKTVAEKLALLGLT